MITEVVNAFVFCLMAHMIGDYFIQNDWMALEKTKAWLPAIAHGATYTIPFIPVVFWLDVAHPWLALLVIGGTHILLDHWYAAKYLIYAKNQIAPARYRPTEVGATGFHPSRPDWIAVWLMIIIDNCLHMAINIAAVVWL